MSKKVYPNINGIAYTGKKMMCNISNVAHKAIKGYCNINGVAYVFWDDSVAPTIKGFWFLFDTDGGYIIEGKRYTVVPEQTTVDVYKTNNGIGFYFFIQQTAGGSIIENITCIVAPISTSAPFRGVWDGQTHLYTTVYSLTVNNDTWYYTAGDPLVYDYEPRYPTDITPDCIVNDSSIKEQGDLEDIVRAFLISHIYTDDLTEDYQVGTQYSLNITDMALTLKKAIAIYLYKNVEYRNDSARANANYMALLNNYPTIIQNILTFANNHNCNCVWIRIIPASFQAIYIECANKSTVPVLITSKVTDAGYTNYPNTAMDGYITIYHYTISFDNGTISYRDTGTTSGKFQNTIGVKFQSYGDFKEVWLSNTGITLNE